MNGRNEPYIDGHVSGTSAWVDMIFVPEEQRGQGLGRKLYEEWEANLPSNVDIVYLMAADTGDGRSTDFWESLGFDYRYESEDPYDMDYEMRWQMMKGVNGRRTPKAKWVEPEEEEDGDDGWDD